MAERLLLSILSIACLGFANIGSSEHPQMSLLTVILALNRAPSDIVQRLEIILDKSGTHSVS